MRLILTQAELIQYWEEKFIHDLGFSLILHETMDELLDWSDADFYNEYHKMIEAEDAMQIGEII